MPPSTGRLHFSRSDEIYFCIDLAWPRSRALYDEPAKTCCHPSSSSRLRRPASSCTSGAAFLKMVLLLPPWRGASILPSFLPVLGPLDEFGDLFLLARLDVSCRY